MKILQKKGLLLSLSFFLFYILFLTNINSVIAQEEGDGPSGYNWKNGYSCYVDYECINMALPQDASDLIRTYYNQALAQCTTRPNSCAADSGRTCKVFLDACPQLKIYGCLATNGSCEDIRDFGFRRPLEARARCADSCLQKGLGAAQCVLYEQPCASVGKYSCLKNGKCQPIIAENLSDAEKKCVNFCGGAKDCVPQSLPCQPPKAYKCLLKDGTCVKKTADSLVDAQNQCKIDCKADDCGVVEGVCPAVAPDGPGGPLAGTSLAALKEMAAAKLNQGQISEPETLISRAINLMLAFIGSIALLLYVVAGLIWMADRGSEEGIGKAKKIIVWTTLGVMVMLASYMLTTMLFDLIPR